MREDIQANRHLFVRHQHFCFFQTFPTYSPIFVRCVTSVQCWKHAGMCVLLGVSSLRLLLDRNPSCVWKGWSVTVSPLCLCFVIVNVYYLRQLIKIVPWVGSSSKLVVCSALLNIPEDALALLDIWCTFIKVHLLCWCFYSLRRCAPHFWEVVS